MFKKNSVLVVIFLLLLTLVACRPSKTEFY